MTIKKIRNLKLSDTEESKKTERAEIRSIRNRLLVYSDWINQPDVNLDSSTIEQWREWRKKLRAVKFVNDYQEAKEYLEELQENEPKVVYLDDRPVSIALYKEKLKKLLNESIKKVMERIHDGYGSRELLNEKFEEATRYLDGKTEHNLLIKLECEASGYTEERVVEDILKDKKNYLIRIYTVEKTKTQFIKRIAIVETFEECDTLQGEILVLGQKKWV